MSTQEVSNLETSFQEATPPETSLLDTSVQKTFFTSHLQIFFDLEKYTLERFISSV